MANKQNVDRVWTLIDRIGFWMHISHDRKSVRSRPMAAQFEWGAIFLLKDADSHKNDDIARDPNVGLAFADPDGQKYVSCTGRAAVSNDGKIREHGSTQVKDWCGTYDDRSLRVLKIYLTDVQYRDNSGPVANYIKMLAAAVSDNRSVLETAPRSGCRPLQCEA